MKVGTIKVKQKTGRRFKTKEEGVPRPTEGAVREGRSQRG